MVWMAVVLFAIVRVLVPWYLGDLDLAEPGLWSSFAGPLALTVGLAIVVWRMFENDGFVLIAVLGWLLATPMWDAVTHFMVLANEPPAAAAKRVPPAK